MHVLQSLHAEYLLPHIYTNTSFLSNKQCKYKANFITRKLHTAHSSLLPFPSLSFVFSALLSGVVIKPPFPGLFSSPFSAYFCLTPLRRHVTAPCFGAFLFPEYQEFRCSPDVHEKQSKKKNQNMLEIKDNAQVQNRF